MSDTRNKYFTDISSNDDGFNAAEYGSAGYGAISIKATEATGYVNPFHGEWSHHAHEHRIPVIHYHFARPELGDPIGQANHFWEVAREHFIRPGDYLSWDVETGGPEEARGWLEEADAHLRRISGTDPWCYCPLSYYEEGGLYVASHKFWIASWGDNRPGNWNWNLGRGNDLIAWQYNGGVGLGDGVGPMTYAGVPGLPDGNVMNPSLARYLAKVKSDHRKSKKR